MGDDRPSRGVGSPARFRPQPLWVRVDRNRVKLGVFVVLFVVGSALLLTSALVAVPGGLFGLAYTADEPWVAEWYWSDFRLVLGIAFGVLVAAGAIASAVQLANAEDWVRNRFKGTVAKRGEYPHLERAVQEMAIAAGLPEAPGIVVLETPTINAYALGTMRSKATIGATRGFLESVPPDEQRAVVAALVARVRSGDILFGHRARGAHGSPQGDTRLGKGPRVGHRGVRERWLRRCRVVRRLRLPV